uniref:DinB family protein n=1 Tax=Algoriphagus sp. TaxID=1872435 RepID=UPI0040486205
MEKELFSDLLKQNIQSCSYAFDAITEENSSYRLNENTASVGFIFRHVAETMALFGYFFGIPTDATNTTMGTQDTGQGKDLSTSRELLQKGYALLEKIISSTPSEGWFEPVETPFFGTVSKARLFSHILYHNSYHAGQVALTIKRASK